MSELENAEFDKWCFTARDERILFDGKPVPVLTTVMYRICGNDQAKFAEAMLALRAAFEAGQKAGP